MAEFHFVCIGTICQRHQLMAEADTENRAFANEFFNFFDNGSQILRVPRPVGKENAVRLGSKNFLRACKRREHGKAATEACQIVKNVLLNAVIHNSYMVFAFAHCINFRSCNFGYLVMNFRQCQQFVNFFLRHFIRNDNALQNAVVSQLSGNGTRIYANQYRNILFIKKIFQRFFVFPVARVVAQLADNIALEEAPSALVKIFIDTVIAYQRISHYNNLVAKRGVSQSFLITAHARCKNNFADSIAFAVQSTSVNAAVF